MQETEDIVTRLRRWVVGPETAEIADEIEATIATLRAEVDKLRAELRLCGKDNCMGRRVKGVTQWVTEQAKDAAVAAVRAEVEGLRKEVHDLNWALGTPGYEQMARPEDQREHEQAVQRTQAMLDRMAAAKAEHDAMVKDAERYRWLRASKAGTIRLDGDHTAPNDMRWAAPQYVFWGNDRTLDAAIDAAKADK